MRSAFALSNLCSIRGFDSLKPGGWDSSKQLASADFGRLGLPSSCWRVWSGSGESPLAINSDRHTVFKYNARQGPAQYDSTQYARVMRELGIQQIFAMSPQVKGRVERIASTFQDRLVTELRLAGTSTIEEANKMLQEFLSQYNRRFAVTAGQPETAYRPVPVDLDLTETISIRHTRKVARDNRVKYQWRVLQLLPGERPSYAGLRVGLLERADGELMIRYQGEAVSYQEAPLRTPVLWGDGSGAFPTGQGTEAAEALTTGHLERDQRKLLADLQSTVEKRAKAKAAAAKGKPLRHQLIRTPAANQQARWEAVYQAKSQGLSLRAIARELGMSRDTVCKYLKAESPPTKLLRARERAKAEVLAEFQSAAD